MINNPTASDLIGKWALSVTPSRHYQFKISAVLTNGRVMHKFNNEEYWSVDDGGCGDVIILDSPAYGVAIIDESTHESFAPTPLDKLEAKLPKDWTDKHLIFTSVTD